VRRLALHPDAHLLTQHAHTVYTRTHVHIPQTSARHHRRHHLCHAGGGNPSQRNGGRCGHP
jgi:hypothetical protein